MAIWEEFNNIDTRDYAAQHPALFAYVKEAMAMPGKQYLLIGDTDHNSGEVEGFQNSPVLAALFKHAAVPHVCIEAVRELAPPETLGAYRLRVAAAKKGMLPEEKLQQAETGFWRNFEITWRRWVGTHPHDAEREDLDEVHAALTELQARVKSGRLTPEKGREVLAKMNEYLINEKRSLVGPHLLGFIHAGLRVTAADSWQWRNMKDRDNGMSLARRLFLGDREVAHYIDTQARGQKTGVLYGSVHFHYKGGMSERLGREKCVHLDIYANRAEYRKKMLEAEGHADFMPDRVYLLAEHALEEPDRRLYRMARTRSDDVIQILKKIIVRTYGRHANPSIKAGAVAAMEHVPQMAPDWFNYVPG